MIRKEAAYNYEYLGYVEYLAKIAKMPTNLAVS